ncbi:MAG: choice-of-anchor Q domain-containing protein [Armatimonadota bacterium]|nr:DUF1565 domain-containing protein [bacterium]
MGKSIIRTILLVFFAILCSSCYGQSVIRVSPSGNDANDGSSWTSAKKTIQAGIDAASNGGGGEIWVAAGIYNERIAIKVYCYLYGGFAGTENTRSQRNFSVNKSILDGSDSGPIVSSTSGISTLACIDGFMIRNSGDCTYAIDCNYSSPAIANNTILGRGGGIKCNFSNSTIINNTISNYSIYSSSGINCYSSSPTIINNTITVNKYGIYCSSSSPTIVNNIVAYNGNGISKGGGTPIPNHNETPILNHNCVYGNTTNYSGIIAGPTDISAAPKFRDDFRGSANGDFHLLSDSPCIDSGDDTVIGADWLDMDGEARIAGSHVDIGSDECVVRNAGPGEAKQLGCPAYVRLNNVVVSAVFSGFYYVQDIERACGIRITQVRGNMPQFGNIVSVSGIPSTSSDGERCLSSYENIIPTGQKTALPLFVACKFIGGGDYGYDPAAGFGQKGIAGASGLNNIGLLVTVCGKIMSIDTTAKRLYVSDGSAMVAVYYGSIALPESVSEGSMVRVTGACSCYKLENGDLGRLIILKDAQSIAPVEFVQQ